MAEVKAAMFGVFDASAPSSPIRTGNFTGFLSPRGGSFTLPKRPSTSRLELDREFDLTSPDSFGEGRPRSLQIPGSAPPIFDRSQSCGPTVSTGTELPFTLNAPDEPESGTWLEHDHRTSVLHWDIVQTDGRARAQLRLLMHSVSSDLTACWLTTCDAQILAPQPSLVTRWLWAHRTCTSLSRRWVRAPTTMRVRMLQR